MTFKVFPFALLLLASGCANASSERSAGLDRAALANVKSIDIVRPPTPDIYEIGEYGDRTSAQAPLEGEGASEASTDPRSGVADILRSEGVDAGNRLAEEVSKQLAMAGYQVRVIDGPWEAEPNESFPFRLQPEKIKSDADALLILKSDPSFRGDDRKGYMPVYIALAIVLAKDRKAQLYRRMHTSGLEIPSSEYSKSSPPSVKVANLDSLLKDSKRTASAIVNAISAVAKTIALDLAPNSVAYDAHVDKGLLPWMKAPSTEVGSFVKGDRVGILVEGNEQPTHTHVGTTVFSNSATKYPFDLQLRSRIQQFLEGDIRKIGLEVIDLRGEGIRFPDVDSLIDGANGHFVIAEQRKAIIGRLRDQLHLKAVIVLNEGRVMVTEECSGGPCTKFYADASGLFSRSFLGFDKFFAVAAYRWQVVTFDPPSDKVKVEGSVLGMVTGRPSKALANFPAPGKIDDMTESEFGIVREEILHVIGTESLAATNALRSK